MPDTPTTPPTPADLLTATTAIVVAVLGHRPILAHELPDLIAIVHATLSGLGAPPTAEQPAPTLTPAVPINNSVTADFIVSLEDGSKVKTLRRHLGKLGMTPEQYRAKWGLPADYPMVAPSYAARRSELAKTSGLGKGRAALAEAA